jgi:hypothetical protein
MASDNDIFVHIVFGFHAIPPAEQSTPPESF